MVNNYNIFSEDLLTLYKLNPKAIEIIFNYGLVNGPITTVDNNNNTILHYVVSANDEHTLIAILNYIQLNNMGTKLINAQNNQLDTAMHIAVRNNNEEIAKRLDNAGANLTLKNKNGEKVETSEEKQDFKKASRCTVDTSINLSDLDDSNNKFNNLNNIITGLMPAKGSNQPEVMSESEIFVAQLADEISKIRSKLTLAKKINYLRGGADDKMSESTFEVKFMSDKQNGGAKQKKASRSSSNESSLIHDDVVAKFMKLKYSEDDARALKAGLYSMVKEQFPNLNNLERAKQMLQLLENKNTLKVLENKMDELREIIANAKKNRENQEKTVKTELSKKKSDSKTKVKKEPKEV